MLTATVDAPRANGASSRHLNDISVATVSRQATAPVATPVTPVATPNPWGVVMTWSLLTLCSVASVVANVAGAQPRLLAQVFAGAPPVVFLACVEVILRAEVPRLHRYTWTRFLGLVLVAAVSAYASYIHQVHLLLSLGEPGGIAHTLPAALDGAMLLASVTLLGLADAKRQHLSRQLDTTRQPVATGVTGVATARHDTTTCRDTTYLRHLTRHPR
jgi:hypothetical protein